MDIVYLIIAVSLAMVPVLVFGWKVISSNLRQMREHPLDGHVEYWRG
jgi:hypothetical protein